MVIIAIESHQGAIDSKSPRATRWHDENDIACRTILRQRACRNHQNEKECPQQFHATSA
jgi:hypothetical protein